LSYCNLQNTCYTFFMSPSYVETSNNYFDGGYPRRGRPWPPLDITPVASPLPSVSSKPSLEVYYSHDPMSGQVTHAETRPAPPEEGK